MNIAFDIHGTLDTHKRIQNIFNVCVKIQHVTSNMKVFVISGPPSLDIKNELKKYTSGKISIISVVDYLKSKNISMYQDENGNWWTENEKDWWKSKGMICEHYKIDIIIDDKIEYKEHMPNSTVFLHVT